MLLRVTAWFTLLTAALAGWATGLVIPATFRGPVELANVGLVLVLAGTAASVAVVGWWTLAATRREPLSAGVRAAVTALVLLATGVGMAM